MNFCFVFLLAVFRFGFLFGNDARRLISSGRVLFTDERCTFQKKKEKRKDEFGCCVPNLGAARKVFFIGDFIELSA